MGKKNTNEINVVLPKTTIISKDIKFESYDHSYMENDSRRGNMSEPRSNDNKKFSDKENKGSTSEAQDNPKVEEERKQTVVQGFDLGLEEFMMKDEIKMDEKMEEQDESSSKITKRDSEYLKFYKFYYEKYHEEHPTWTPGQITTIVSLLWKKKKHHERTTPASKTGMTSRRSNRALTAKEAFKMEHKNLTKEEIDDKWKRLPQESKNFWKKEGDSYCTGAKLSEVSSVDNCRVPIMIHNAAKSLLGMI